MIVLAFDTETTGLPANRNSSIKNVNEWPYVMQLCYIVFDLEEKEILEVKDIYVRLSDNIIPTPESVAIHGITKEYCDMHGIPMSVALDKFNRSIRRADLIIGHNISFDKRVMMVESIREVRSQYFTVDGVRKPEYCTMKHGKDICKIEVANQTTGEIYYKYPKLAELHKKLFHYTPRGCHNALADVLICLRCYYFMNTDGKDLIYDCKRFAYMWRCVCVV